MNMKRLFHSFAKGYTVHIAEIEVRNILILYDAKNDGHSSI